MSLFMVAFIVCDHQSFLFVIIVYKIGRVKKKKKSKAFKNIKEDPYTGSITNAITKNQVVTSYLSLQVTSLWVIFHIRILFHIFSAFPFHSQKLAAHKESSGPIMHARDPKSERIHSASQEHLTRGDLVSFSGLVQHNENLSTQNRKCNLKGILFLFF